jgi:hypothetical protein
MTKGTITQASATQPLTQDRAYGVDGLAQTIFVAGVWGGATLKLEVLAKAMGKWFALKDVFGNPISFTADGYANFYVRGGSLRVSATGTSGTTAVDWEIPG